MLYLLIDGDGHQEMTEDTIKAKLLDLVQSNVSINLKTTQHTLAGQPLVVVEVSHNEDD